MCRRVFLFNNRKVRDLLVLEWQDMSLQHVGSVICIKCTVHNDQIEFPSPANSRSYHNIFANAPLFQKNLNRNTYIGLEAALAALLVYRELLFIG